MDELQQRLERFRGLKKDWLEVVELVCELCDYPTIGGRLFIDVETVQKRMGNVYDALGLADLPKDARRVELGKLCALMYLLPEDERRRTSQAGQTIEVGNAVEETPSIRALVAVLEDEPQNDQGQNSETSAHNWESRRRAMDEWTPQLGRHMMPRARRMRTGTPSRLYRRPCGRVALRRVRRPRVPDGLLGREAKQTLQSAR